MSEMKSAVWLALIVSAAFLLVPIIADDAAAGTPHRAIHVTQNGYAAELAVDIDTGESVKWDLGDGRIVTGPSVTATWEPGLYLLQAAIVSSSGEIEHLQRWIGFYDESPATSVARNDEYRYCVYTGPDPSLTVKDSSGRLASWLTYDSGHRVLTGIPRETGFYHVWLNDRYWSINVTDAPLSAPWVRFSASVAGETISASPTGSAQDSVTRYSWSLTDLDGSLVSAFEGKNLTMTAGPGIYILKLQQVGPSGPASYSQIIEVTSAAEPVPEPAEPISVWPMVLGAMSIVLLLVSAASRSIWPAGAALLCATVAIMMVIL